MDFSGWALADVAAVVESCLRDNGMSTVVVGGSAITIHVPQVYTSYDIDLAVTTGINKRRIGAALEALDFRLDGRSFVNETTQYTVDIVADTPYVDRRPIHDFATAETPHGQVTVLKLEDALADRIAAFLYWNDSQSLEVAERAVTAAKLQINWKSFLNALDKLERGDRVTDDRYRLALQRLQRAYDVYL